MAQTQTSAPPVPPASPQSTGKYLLLGPHVNHDGLWLPAGAQVGTDTSFAWPDPPSNQMIGLDNAGKAAVNKLHMDLYGRPMPAAAMGSTIADDAKRDAEEAKSDPVSYGQARERGIKEYHGVPTLNPLPPNPLLPTSLSGDATHTYGEIVGSSAAPTTRF